MFKKSYRLEKDPKWDINERILACVLTVSLQNIFAPYQTTKE